MENIYHDQLVKLLNTVSPRLANTHKLEFKNVFGAVGGYIDGNIFVSYGKFGVAFRLSPDTLTLLLQEKESKHLKYFPNGHIKKEYAVLSKRVLTNKHRLKKLVDESISYVLLSESRKH